MLLQTNTRAPRLKRAWRMQVQAHTTSAPPRPIHKPARPVQADADPDVLYDAIIVGGGMGGLTTATQMAAKGAKVLVLEKYVQNTV